MHWLVRSNLRDLSESSTSKKVISDHDEDQDQEYDQTRDAEAHQGDCSSHGIHQDDHGDPKGSLAECLHCRGAREGRAQRSDQDQDGLLPRHEGQVFLGHCRIGTHHILVSPRRSELRSSRCGRFVLCEWRLHSPVSDREDQRADREDQDLPRETCTEREHPGSPVPGHARDEGEHHLEAQGRQEPLVHAVRLWHRLQCLQAWWSLGQALHERDREVLRHEPALLRDNGLRLMPARKFPAPGYYTCPGAFGGVRVYYVTGTTKGNKWYDPAACTVWDDLIWTCVPTVKDVLQYVHSTEPPEEVKHLPRTW